LRSHMKKGGWKWIKKQKPDVICLQELKAKPEQLTEAQMKTFEGYTVVWNPAERPGYSGVATMVSAKTKEHTIGFGLPKFDVEGRVIQTRFDDFILLNIYFPSGTTGMVRVNFKLEFYKALLKHIDKLHKAGENLILTGDFNTAHNEIDLARPKENARTSGFMPEERAMLGLYFDAGLVDTFRALYPEKQQFSWWTSRFASARKNNIGWRIDYFLVSQKFFKNVKDIAIFDKVEGSDHCPVMLELK
ncbi:MAG TPA: exodeoxyribonuclease III, partial [Terriglobales bacterium]|nr:exodeoxyribonuclease III [Terriglobales bacterium]